jgi:hypothetical protein
MSSSPERQAGASEYEPGQDPGAGYPQRQATAGYEPGQAPGAGQPARGAAAGSTMTYGPGHAPEAGYPAGGRHATGEHRAAVVGLTAAAGTLMVLAGLWGVIVGTVALAHGHVFVSAPNYTFRYNIRSWGWVELIMGIVIFAAGVCIFLGMTWARILGAVLAVLDAVANFMFIPYQPVWSIVLIALDGFIIWALLSPRRANDFV